MFRTAFIITKPLQFMIAASIIDQLGIAASSDLLVTNTFSAAEVFASQYHELGPRWGNLWLFEDIPAAHEYARRKRAYKCLFIDSDPGIQKAIQLLRFKVTNPSASIMVYEEGEGTYRNDLYTSPKREILHFAGVGAAFGGSRLSSGIFVFKPDEYRQRVGRFGGTPFQIEPTLLSFIVSNYGDLSALFSTPKIESAGETTCNLYLGNWDFHLDEIAELARLSGQFFFKPHPHLKALPPMPDGVEQLPGGVPVELIIISLLDKFERVNVYHHGSSVQRYLSIDRINYIAAATARSPDSGLWAIEAVSPS